MKKKYLTTIIIAGATFLTACNSGNIRRNPGKIYMPDMVYSQAYDAYTENPNTPNGLTSQEPVAGTIARGQALPDHLKEEDVDAYAALSFPYEFNLDEIAEGKRLYAIHCGICHGDKMDGQGPLFTSGKYASMPATLVSEAHINMRPGTIYHAIKYGKNMMGSYASQLDGKQRWQVIAYIKQYQSENGGAPFTMGQNLSEGQHSTAQVVTDVDAEETE